MFIAFKDNGAEDILQKHRLKYILRISIVFQVDRADTFYCVRIQVNGTD
jgi:hypothetical protein